MLRKINNGDKNIKIRSLRLPISGENYEDWLK